MARLSENSYGKAAVRVTKVVRNGAQHSVFEMDVEILLSGDFDAVYTKGDNSTCVPTDTMKNTVYALAKKHAFDSPEQFALILTEHFVTNFAHVNSATARIEQTAWERIPLHGKPHEHAFAKSSAAKRTAVADRNKAAVTLTGGIKGLEVMKTTHSGFVGFHRDQYTTLKETRERIFGTSVEAAWDFSATDADFNRIDETARRTILEVFAAHDSLGVQHTMFEMGNRMLADIPEISRVSFVLPNQHRLLANLEPFGMTNENEIFVNSPEPYGIIKGTVVRD